LARLGGLGHETTTDPEEAAVKLAMGTLVELRTDRAASVDGLRSIAAAVSAGL
jgi:hypothetical protein